MIGQSPAAREGFAVDWQSLQFQIEEQDLQVVSPVVDCCEGKEHITFDEFIELAENEYFRAAIDVYPVEPVPADSTFRKKSNILFTSHVAGALDYSYKNIRDMMMNDIKKILNGMPPIHLQHADPDKAIMRRDR